MTVGRVALGVRKHFQQMLDVWSARKCVHRIVTETVDDQGNIIERSETETNIFAIIGNTSFDKKDLPIGQVQSGDLCLYYWYTNTDVDILVSKQLTETTQRHDQIDFQGTSYIVANLNEIAYDLNTAGDDHEPIFAKYTLRKVAN